MTDLRDPVAHVRALTEEMRFLGSRIEVLEAALREIDEECPRNYSIEYARGCFDSIIEIVAAALAPAPAPAVGEVERLRAALREIIFTAWSDPEYALACARSALTREAGNE